MQRWEDLNFEYLTSLFLIVLERFSLVCFFFTHPVERKEQFCADVMSQGKKRVEGKRVPC